MPSAGELSALRRGAGRRGILGELGMNNIRVLMPVVDADPHLFGLGSVSVCSEMEREREEKEQNRPF